MGLAILSMLVVSGCDRSDATASVGYPGYSRGGAAAERDGQVTPPSSGTSNGTGEAVPNTGR